MSDINALLALEQEALILAAGPGSETARAGQLATARHYGKLVSASRYPHRDTTGHAASLSVG